MPTHKLRVNASGWSRFGGSDYPAGTPVMVEPFGRYLVQLTFPYGESVAVWDARTAARDLEVLNG